jgi:hypothetical protein
MFIPAVVQTQNTIVVYKKDGDTRYSTKLLVDSSTKLLVDESHSDPSYSDEVSLESTSEAWASWLRAVGGGGIMSAEAATRGSDVVTRGRDAATGGRDTTTGGRDTMTGGRGMATGGRDTAQV